MIKFKTQTLIITPFTVLWTGLLVTIIVMLSSAKQSNNTTGDDQPLTWQDMKEYQLEIRGNKVIMYDYNRVVSILPLDNHCNLTQAIEEDNR